MGDDPKAADFLTISELFEKKLRIPSYQRPYSWDQDHVVQLLDDLTEAWENKRKAYLVGNIIIHKEEEKIWNLVDGQQRVITFALILRWLEGKECEECKAKKFLMERISPLSTRRIKENYLSIERYFQRYFPSIREDKNEFKEFFLNSTWVSYIIAETLDQAFFFFDSQNTRGKPIARKDLLKVHHLRKMPEDGKKEKKRNIARRWEEWEKFNEEENYLGQDDFLEFLFDQVLGLARKSVGGMLEGDDLYKIDVYKEFRAEGEGRQEIPWNRLNHYTQPNLFDSFYCDLESETIYFIAKATPMIGPHVLRNALDFLPFELTHSIAGGEDFFLYAFKYANLLKKLRETEKIFGMLDGIWGTGNGYLRKVYRAALFYYYDKFGNMEFEDFAVLLFLLLAYYRSIMDRIDAKGVVKYEWNEKGDALNPFKLIMLKSSPEHVLRAMKRYLKYQCPAGQGEGKWWEKLDGTQREFYEGKDVYSEDFRKKRDALRKEIWEGLDGRQK